MNTNIELKLKQWPVFVAACQRQLESGGERYAMTDQREVTDLVCDIAGTKWIAGTIVKYCGELVNTSPKLEQDFFKIAVYAFLWWVKEQDNLTGHDRGEDK